MMHPNEYETMLRCEDRHWWYHALRETAAREIARRLPPQDTIPPRLIDLGCGTGGQTLFLHRRFPQFEITGIDLDVALKYAKTRGAECQWIEASAEDLPMPDDYFDSAVSFDMLCNGSVTEKPALKEAFRVLKPGGILYVNVPAFGFLTGPHDTAVNNVRRYSRGRLKKLLNEGGFQIEEICYWNSLLFLPGLAARLLSRAARRKQSDLGISSGWINGLLKAVLAFERALSFSFPFGMSLFAVVRKPV